MQLTIILIQASLITYIRTPISTPPAEARRTPENKINTSRQTYKIKRKKMQGQCVNNGKNVKMKRLTPQTSGGRLPKYERISAQFLTTGWQR